MADDTEKTRYRRAGGVSRSDFVVLQTRVPPKVRDHYHQAAKERGISLSLYFEELAKVDPLADASDEDPKKNTNMA